jgi:hypothetical protein
LCHPGMESGPKYIDPNMGEHSDKFIVDCDFEKKNVETCIRPKQTTFTSKMDSVDAWKYLISDLNTNDKIEYDADTVALRYMRLNSMSVRQNITYKCVNQHAMTPHVMVKTAEGAEVGSDSALLDVLKDECSKLDGKVHSAVFELKTKNLAALPITDIKIRNVLKAGEFEIELGPICFS